MLLSIQPLFHWIQAFAFRILISKSQIWIFLADITNVEGEFLSRWMSVSQLIRLAIAWWLCWDKSKLWHHQGLTSMLCMNTVQVMYSCLFINITFSPTNKIALALKAKISFYCRQDASQLDMGCWSNPKNGPEECESCSNTSRTPLQ